MRISVFWRLGLTYLALLLAVLGSLDWLTAASLRHEAQRETFAELEALAKVARARPPRLDDPSALHVWLAEMAASGARVKVIAAGGRVLADSERNSGAAESNPELPEIRDALASPSGEGRAARHSDALNRDMVYLAMRSDPPGGAPLALDFALPQASTEQAISDLRRRLWLISLVLLAIAGTMSFWASRSFSSRVERLKRFSRRVAAGDFRALERDTGRDALGELAAALGDTAAQLEQTIRTLTVERNRSRAILGSMVEGVAVVSGDERVLYCNRAFEQILELPAGGAQNRKLVEAVRQTELIEAVRRVLAGQEEVTAEAEVGTVRPRNFSVTATAVQAEGGAGAVLVLHDITELRRLERVRRDFVANVSHEFKTPLTAIQGFAETLLGGALEDKANRRRFIEIIREHARRLARLTDDLLKLSRIEAGKYEVVLQPVNVAALTSGCVDTARIKAEPKGLTIATNMPEGLPDVRGDAAQLGEVMQNLLDNAIQYTPAGGRIEVSAATQDRVVVFTVADTGIGIPESDLERIFERFYRVDAARSREAGGTGLGLSIARHIVESHGGRIWVESAVGQGSRFHFSIPTA